MLKGINLFPKHFKVGRYSGSIRDFSDRRVTKPRGGEDMLEYWYSDDPEVFEYLDQDFQRYIDNYLVTLKKQGWDPNRQFAFCIAQSHLDLGWLWRFRQGVAKAEATFSKLHEHFKLIPYFTFTGSQPAQYQ